MGIKDLFPSGSRRLNVWDDFSSSMNSLQREFNRLFEDFSGSLPSFSSREFSNFSPQINVSETDTKIKIEAELPGMEEKDIDVSLNDYALILKGEKKFEKEDKDEDHHVVERSYGSFRRVVPLPPNVDRSKIDAHFKKGVLRISIPKTEQAKEATRKINVKGEG